MIKRKKKEWLITVKLVQKLKGSKTGKVATR